MARKSQLRGQRTGTVINVTSKKQESDIIQALGQVKLLPILNKDLEKESVFAIKSNGI